MPAELTLTRLFTVSGDSMLPLLEPGDEVWVRAGAAVPGDLTVFARFTGKPPALIVHRLLERRETRGDACFGADEPQEAGDFLGRVVAFRRGETLVRLDTPEAALLDRLCRLYARLFYRWWRETALDWIERRGFARTARILRAAALAPARLFFFLLYSRNP